MAEHLHTVIIVIAFNFCLLKTSFFYNYQSHLLKIYFAYSTWTPFRDSLFNFEFENIERFRFSNKSNIFGPTTFKKYLRLKA